MEKTVIKLNLKLQDDFNFSLESLTNFNKYLEPIYLLRIYFVKAIKAACCFNELFVEDTDHFALFANFL